MGGKAVSTESGSFVKRILAMGSSTPGKESAITTPIKKPRKQRSSTKVFQIFGFRDKTSAKYAIDDIPEGLGWKVMIIPPDDVVGSWLADQPVDYERAAA